MCCTGPSRLGFGLLGEARNIGEANFTTAELFVIYLGLKMAWRKGYTKIIIESDYAFVVNPVLGRQEANGKDRVIVECCKDLFSPMDSGTETKP